MASSPFVHRPLLTGLHDQRCKSLAESIATNSEPSDIPKDYPTVCHEIYHADELPDSQKTVRRLQHEVETFVIAGTETSAHALACITFHVLDNPSVLRRLQEELNNFNRSSSRAACLKEIEQLPYLTCVLLEGLRLSYGLAMRLPRVAPDRVIKYRDFDIPAGVSVRRSYHAPTQPSHPPPSIPFHIYSSDG